MNSQAIFRQHLTRSGNSVTAARLAVYDVLANQQAPSSMNQLVRAVAPDVNRASVYRCIALFESLGVVQRIQIGWKYKLELSNDFQDHHHHLVCTECGSISSFHEPSGFDAMLERIANLQAFEITAHQLELRGVCKSCQKTSEHLT